MSPNPKNDNLSNYPVKDSESQFTANETAQETISLGSGIQNSAFKAAMGVLAADSICKGKHQSLRKESMAEAFYTPSFVKGKTSAEKRGQVNGSKISKI